MAGGLERSSEDLKENLFIVVEWPEAEALFVSLFFWRSGAELFGIDRISIRRRQVPFASPFIVLGAPIMAQ